MIQINKENIISYCAMQALSNIKKSSLQTQVCLEFDVIDIANLITDKDIAAMTIYECNGTINEKIKLSLLNKFIDDKKIVLQYIGYYRYSKPIKAIIKAIINYYIDDLEVMEIIMKRFITNEMMLKSVMTKDTKDKLYTLFICNEMNK